MRIYMTLIIALCTAIPTLYAYAGNSANAETEELRPLLSDNKVWEYVRELWNENEEGIVKEYEINRYAVTGTHEFNGRKYTTIGHIGGVKWNETHSADGSVSFSSARNIPESGYREYLREEGEKVFMLVMTNSTDREEALLYDFSIADDTELICVSRSWAPDSYQFDYDLTKAKVYSIDNVSHDNKRLRKVELVNPWTLELIYIVFGEKVEITPENVETYGMVWLDGVGSIGHGILTEPGGYPGVPMSEGYGYSEVFNNLYDRDGNILYPGKGVETPTIDTIHEDWTWEYWPQIYDAQRSYTFEMSFSGTTEIDGVTWHNFKTDHINYTNHEGNESGVLSDSSTFLIRVDGDKWFVRLPVDASEAEIPDFDWKVDASEAPLYDFSCQVGDEMQTLDWKGLTTTCKVTDTSTIDVAGQTLRVLNVTFVDTEMLMTIVEGIGPVEYGVLPYVQNDVMAGWGYFNGKLPCFANQSLASVKDEQGNIVFEPGMLSGIDGVTADEERRTDTRIYDLMGRELREAQPGTVYIQGGKKYVAR